MSLVIKKASELQTKDSEWLIEGVIPLRSLCFLSAAPKLGKTMVALELATALTTGKPAFGKYNVPKVGKVLYFAGEDAESGFKKRIDGFAKGKEADVNSLELYTITEQMLRIDTEEGRAVLCTMIEQLKPDLLVLDNLSRIHRSNENNAIVMGEIFEFIQAIKIKYGIAILLVHHMGKDGSLRGSSQIDSYYEAAIFLRAKKQGKVMEFRFRNYEERDSMYEINNEQGMLRVLLIDDDVTVEKSELAKKQVVVPMTSGYTIEEQLKAGLVVKTENGGYRWIA